MSDDQQPYVDGFVAAIPQRNKDVYLEIAKDAAAIYREHGALRVVESWGDDVPEGKITSFRRAVDAKDDEVVVFAWIWWPSKATRDRGNAAVMNDPRMQTSQEPPFDSKRMIYGGFQVLMDQ